jgi:hypothetical protein
MIHSISDSRMAEDGEWLADNRVSIISYVGYDKKEGKTYLKIWEDRIEMSDHEPKAVCAVRVRCDIVMPAALVGMANACFSERLIGGRNSGA